MRGAGPMEPKAEIVRPEALVRGVDGGLGPPEPPESANVDILPLSDSFSEVLTDAMPEDMKGRLREADTPISREGMPVRLAASHTGRYDKPVLFRRLQKL